MDPLSIQSPASRTPGVYNHAIVIGGSIAGLTTARILADYFARVTVVERDAPAHAGVFRPGAAQARHPHGLLTRGQAILEQMFPGLGQEYGCAGRASCPCA